MNGVSIVICCYNSALRLPETLAHLKAQIVPEYIPWEVVVVDNASTDGTGEVAKELWGELPVVPFRVVQEPKPGLMNARIKGFETAQYEFVSFIDDDNWVADNWVHTVYMKMLEYPQAGAIGGRSDAVFESEPPEWFERYKGWFAVGDQHNDEGELPIGKTIWGAGITIRNNAWQELFKKGFKPVLSGRKGNNLTTGEDVEICYLLYKNTWRLFYSSELFLKHYIPKNRMKWSYFCKLMRKNGQASVYLNIYRKTLSKNCDIRRMKKYFLRNIVSSVIMLMKKPRIFFLALKLSDEGNDDVINTQKSIGRVIEISRLLINFRQIEEMISENR